MNLQPEQLHHSEELEQTISDYLRAHPDFFERNALLLKELELPHQKGDSISLVERQIRLLRQQSEEYKQQLQELIAIANENEQLNDRLHQLTITLIGTIDFDEVINVLQDKLHEDFQAEAVELHLFSAAELEGESNPDLDGYKRFLDEGEPRCGRLPKKQLEYLFGPQADDIQSMALIAIKGESLLGLLAFGSNNSQRFHPGMGTEYLTRLGEIVSKTLEVVTEPGS